MLYSAAGSTLGGKCEDAGCLFFGYRYAGTDGVWTCAASRLSRPRIFVSLIRIMRVESFELAALDFLVKPLQHERLAATISRLQEYVTIRRKANMLSHALGADTVFIKDGTQQIKLALHDIIYLEALNNYTCVVTAGRKYTVLSTLTNLMQEAAFTELRPNPPQLCGTEASYP